jgi:hypothetical protein
VKSTLFSLQGYVRIGTKLASGKAGAMYWAGNVPEAQLELASESSTKNESFTGQRLPYGKLKTSQTGRFTGTFDEWNLKNLALGLHAAILNTATGSVTAEEFETGLVVGDQIRLDHPYVSALVLTDDAGAPVTVAVDDYKLVGHNQSIVEVVNLAAYVQPFSAAYTYAAYDNVEVFAEDPQEVYVVFDGINTETGDGVLIDLYRTKFDPFASLGLIHAEYGSLPFAADVLFDPLNVDANGKGGFAKIRQKTPT